MLRGGPPKSSLLNSNPGTSPGGADGGDEIGNRPNVAPHGCHLTQSSEPNRTDRS